jgi:hypothetical protein
MFNIKLIEAKIGKSSSELNRLWKSVKLTIKDINPKSSEWYLVAMNKFKGLIK